MKIAIIPARGGSKRIPRKNIKTFYGRPIIAYSIKAAIDSGLFDEVMVSTDDDEIAEIARVHGASVPFFRSAENSSDYAITADVLREVLGEYAKRGQEFDITVCIYPTAPFVTPAELRSAVSMMERHRPTSIVPVVKFSFPPQRCFVVDKDGRAHYREPEYKFTRSQDIEPLYHDVGQFYVFDTEKFLADDGTTDDIMTIELPQTVVQDIDNEDDWKLAEMKYGLLMEGDDR